MGRKTETKTTACRGGGGGDDDPDPFLLHLPEEVLIQILVRLPIQSLLRFKSVYKSWHVLIQSSFFIDLHTTFKSSSSSSSNFGSFILRTEINPSSKNEILMLSECEGSEYGGSEYGDQYRCTDGSWHKFTTDRKWHWDGFDRRDDDKDDQEVFKADDDDDDQLLLKVDNLELPSGYKLTDSEDIVDSCNGLICLHDTRRDIISLWNPATRQIRILPKSITIEIDDDDDFRPRMLFVAFGFDIKTKDYKVLLIRNYFPPYTHGDGSPLKGFCRVQLYSLSTDSWRLINSPLALPDENHGLYMNGSCFFIAIVYPLERNTYNRFINSFDFTKEIFTTIQLPDHRQQYYLRCLGGEKMALFKTLRKRSYEVYDGYDSDDEYGYEDCDIWVLNEHAAAAAVNKESWTKLHSFQIENSIRGLPIGISNNGKFAFLEILPGSYRRKIQLYNLVTKEVKLDIPFCLMKSKVYVYKPSLVSINCGNGAAAAPGGDEVIGGAV